MKAKTLFWIIFLISLANNILGEIYSEYFTELQMLPLRIENSMLIVLYLFWMKEEEDDSKATK